MSSPIKDIGTFGTRTVGGYKPVQGPYALDAMAEMGALKDVHHKDSVREREQRERAKTYDAAKAELAARRAASGR